jgi:KipI family sensor histidine kinase inhibitor
VSRFQVQTVGDSALLLELDAIVDPLVNARAVAIGGFVRGAGLPGVLDVVSTFRSVAVYLDPAAASVAAVRIRLEDARADAPAPVQGRTVEVPVVYGGEHGPDLDAVAAFGGLTADEVVEVHAGRDYRVYMLGFLPGFPYLGSVDARIAAPRKAAPRPRVAAGSIGIAGLQTGIYPRDSPGGWQIIGRTMLEMFNPSRLPAALVSPGDTVRFVPQERGDFGSRPDGQSPAAADAARQVTVISPGLLTTVQDRGRWGHQAIGVGVAGPMDRGSHDAANAAVGNTGDAATLEVTIAGPELRFENRAGVAVVGADLGATIDGSPLVAGRAHAARPGSVLRFAGRRRGARADVAIDGGIDTVPVLGSRATLITAGIGRPLRAGDRLPLGPEGGSGRPTEPAPLPDGGTRVRVSPGPQRDCADAATFDALCGRRFVVSPQSNRMAYRLGGARVPIASTGEMISDATFSGAIQITPSGEVILLMADRQTTGGYPQVAVLAPGELSRAGQLAPGDWIEFDLDGA